MRETSFINQNKEKWDEFEKILASDKKDPDKLSNLFIQVSDDLSYSRTFYKNRSVRIYLNTLAQQVFSTLYRNKRSRRGRFAEFWKEELPQLVWNSRRAFVISFSVFVLSLLIGVFSCKNDPEFPRVILGDAYVNMTIENIKKHDPMAVYKEMHEVNMFLGISLNNLKVSVFIFLLGIVFSFGSVGYIAYNGIMVGTFQYFFYQQGLFATSALTIWMHGTLEMSAMVIAGAAGITMGNGLVFPGTYSRAQSFMISARRGLKILLGVAPIVVFAAVIESFVTRYTQLPPVFRICVIAFSLLFILGYFVWYPWRKSKAGFTKTIQEAQLQPNGEQKIAVSEIHSNGELFKEVFILYRRRFRNFFAGALSMAGLYTLSLFLIAPKSGEVYTLTSHAILISGLFSYSSYPYLIFLNIPLLALLLWGFAFFIRKETRADQVTLSFSLGMGLKFLVLSVLLNCIVLLQNGWMVFLLIVLLPFFFFLTAVISEKPLQDKRSSLNLLLTLVGAQFWKFIGLFYLLLLLCTLFFFVLASPLLYIYFELLSWNFRLTMQSYHSLLLGFMAACSILVLGLVLPLLMSGMSLLYYSLNEIRFATHLRSKIATIGTKTTARK
jgi:uncharacterized membrane protein SpoIIM required for sporulation